MAEVPGGVPHEFVVTVIARTDEEAQQVINTLTAGPKVLGDMTDPRSFPFSYLIYALRAQEAINREGETE